MRFLQSMRAHRGVSIGQMLGVITIFAILVLFEVC